MVESNVELYGALDGLVKKRLDRRFEGIVISGLDSIKTLENASLFYASTHKSHVDYVVIGRVIYQGGLRIPLFIAGDNLDIGAFGKLLNSAGAVFIKRKDFSTAYLMELCASLTKKMLDGHDLVLFPEAGRSYSGGIMPTRPLLFRVPIQAQRQGKKPVYVVPVAVSYDLVLEDFELSDLTRECRKEEWKDLRKLIISREKGGNIYIDFGEPISIEKFLRQGKQTAHSLGIYVFKQAARLYRVTAPALSAASINGSSEFSIRELTSEVRRNLRILERNNANLKTVNSMPLTEIVRRGLTLLERRGLISNGANGYLVGRPDILKYYANTLEHLLVK